MSAVGMGAAGVAHAQPAASTGPNTTAANAVVVAAPGSYGYSICMINATQNHGGGATLGNFYQTARVLNGDQFRVQITP